MTVDLVSPRPDLVFLKRRLPVPTSSQMQPKSSPLNLSAPTERAADSLNLSAPSSDSGSLRITSNSIEEVLHKKPSVTTQAVLTLEAPVVRLNSRQASMGALRASGVASFGWQDRQKNGGIVNNPKGSTNFVTKEGITRKAPTEITYEVPSFVNRPVVAFYEDKFVMNLRHFRELRRVGLEAKPGEDILITLLDGKTITVNTANGNQIAYLSVINNEIEIRVERVDVSLNETFNFITEVTS